MLATWLSNELQVHIKHQIIKYIITYGQLYYMLPSFDSLKGKANFIAIYTTAIVLFNLAFILES